MLTPYFESIPHIEAIRHEEDWDEVDARFGYDFVFTMRFRNKYITSSIEATNAVIARIKKVASGFPDTIRSNIPTPVKDYYYQGR